MACWIRSLTNISPRPHGTMTLVEPKQTVTFIVPQSHHQRLEHSSSAVDNTVLIEQTGDIAVLSGSPICGLTKSHHHGARHRWRVPASSSRSCGWQQSLWRFHVVGGESGSTDEKYDKYHPVWVLKINLQLIILLWCAYSRCFSQRRALPPPLHDND